MLSVQEQEFGVLVYFPKDHSKPAWLSQNGKTRWTKKQAKIHCESVISGKIWVAKRTHAEVKAKQ